MYEIVRRSDGPCCCGAWHHEDEWPDEMREFVRRKDAEQDRINEAAPPGWPWSPDPVTPIPAPTDPWVAEGTGPAGGADVPGAGKAGERSWLGLALEKVGRWIDEPKGGKGT